MPLGWKFALPGGDPVKGRQVFADLECYKCHAIHGENFPAAGGDAKNVGPELTGMGGQHPGEYFAESIMNPSAVIEKGKGYEGPDGLSKMPLFNESMTVQEAIDLVAYLRSLKPVTGAPAGHREHHHGLALARGAAFGFAAALGLDFTAFFGSVTA